MLNWQRNKSKFVALGASLLVLVVVIAVVAVNMNGGSVNSKTKSGKKNNVKTEEDIKKDTIEEASAMALQYNYDDAITLLSTVASKDSDNKKSDSNENELDEVDKLIEEYKSQRDSLVATSPLDVTHIFFHSLIVDPARAFSITGNRGWDSGTPGYCQWMTTVDEFNAMMQQMYERGYVLVDINDLVEKTVDENGYTHMAPKDIYLPEGKKPFVLSLDDISYYHSYDNRGIATKLIVGEDGKPTNEYIDENGETQIGSYDAIPLLDDFVEEHPDFSYKGAKGTIALTGYNGVLGYRTDYVYRDRVDLSPDQQEWLDAHPDFDWEKECEEARRVADCIKANGWTFASHTWGHIRVGDADLGWIQTDTEKWLNYVAPIVGDTDILIFAHGQDLSEWNAEYADTDKFQYLKSKGFNIYCKVSSNETAVQIADGYMRMGRRNLDGYRLYHDVYGEYNRLGDLFDQASVFDENRPTDASLYTLN